MDAKEFLEKYDAGNRDFMCIDLQKADLHKTDLSGCMMHWADLSKANLSGANLDYVSLHGAKLNRADLNKSNLTDADLSEADLRWANLNMANLTRADLSGANLSEANLYRANLFMADLRWAILYKANLEEAGLHSANLTGANLSESIGLLDASAWLKANFKADDLGVIVYKAFGETPHSVPMHWEIKPGKFITETVQPLPILDCASGINFATQQWINDTYIVKDVVVWKCRIRWWDLAGVVVPYDTNGKARCSRLELLELLRK